MKRNGLFKAWALLLCAFGFGFAQTAVEEPEPDGFNRPEEWFEYFRKRIKPLPSGSRRDSLVLRMLWIKTGDNIQGYHSSDTSRLAHVANGRVDSLHFKSLSWPVPEEICELTELKYLRISGDSGTWRPIPLGRLKKLVHLDLSECYLTGLSNELESLRNLQSLNLNYNRLTSIPAFVFKLPALRTLEFSMNRISKVGSDIKNLTRLSILKADQNRIKYLPVEITQLPHLDSVDLSENHLLDENLDSSVIKWLNKRFYSWRKRTTGTDIRDFLSGLGQPLLEKRPGYKFGTRYINFDGYESHLVSVSKKTWTEMLAKADSQSVSSAIKKMAQGNSDRFSPRETVRGLLSAYAFCEKYPAIPDIIAHEIGRLVPGYNRLDEDQRRGDGYEFRITYPFNFKNINQNLSRYEEVNRTFLAFWGDRKRDKSIDEALQLLNLVRRYCFPEIVLDTGDLRVASKPTPLKTFYFSDRTFGDTINSDMDTGFALRENLVLHYLDKVYPKDGAEWIAIKDPRLWQNLLALHSPYFDSALVYFAGSEDSNHQFLWKETGLDLELLVKWEYDEEGPCGLQTHLVFPKQKKNRPRIFVGIPREEYNRNKKKPGGYFTSKQLQKTRKADTVDIQQYIVGMPNDSQPCQWVTKTYSVPPECPKLKSLLVVDLYLGRNWEHVKNFNPKSKRYEEEDSLPLSKSTLYTVSSSGDTATLNEDLGYYFGWNDGGGEMYGAYTLAPQFADLNGDGRVDLFVETRNGTLFFNQRENGSFEKR